MVSRYRLDARDPTARRAPAGLSDLVGAVRLPEGAFAGSSGTDVVADLVLRRRPAYAEPAGTSWESTVQADLDGTDTGPSAPTQVEVNEHLAARPELVLGRLTVGRGMYRNHELTVEPTGPLEGIELRLDVAVAVDVVADDPAVIVEASFGAT